MLRRKEPRTLTGSLFLPLLVGGGAAVMMEIGRRLFRDKQMFLPSREPVKSWDPLDYGIPREAVEEHWIETPDGEQLHAWYCRSKKPVASGIFCHGNTGNLTISAPVIPHLLDAGFNVLFFDYRGFGRSTGSASLPGTIADAVTAARFHETLRPKHLPSILYGFSLGGAVAAQVIRRHHFDGLILQSTFTNLPAIAKLEFPRLPLHLLADRFFDTTKALRKLRVPLLILHGSADETCPDWMAKELFEACPGEQKRLEIVDGGMHKDLFSRDPDSLVWHINRFASELPRNAPPAPVEQPSLAERLVDAFYRVTRRHSRRRAASQSL